MYNLNNFNQNGVAWPFKYEDENFLPDSLEDHYKNFQTNAEKKYLMKNYAKAKFSIKIF